MDIRLIVSDIDHTILSSFGHVTPATVAAVRALREQGREFVVASGRWFPSARMIAADQLGIEDGYMIICNGSAVVKMDGTPLKEYGLTAEQAQTAYDIMKRENVMMTAYTRNAIYRLHTERLTSLRLPEVSSFFGGNAYALVENDEDAFLSQAMLHPYKMEAYCDDTDKIARLQRTLEEAGLVPSSSFPVNLEIVAPGMGKGAATRWLTDYLHLSREQVMGFGDYSNDIPMLESVGWPVAVGNALPQVKAVARIIAPACEDDGVAKTIQEYVLGAHVA